jgi:predicted enzyme related to lactoylglutathione lyase
MCYPPPRNSVRTESAQESLEVMTYTMLQPGEGTGGGLMKQMMPGAPSAWLAYVNVNDVKESTAKATSLGAQVVKDVTEIPGMGWFSIIVDPTGAALGLWQAAAR